MTSFKEAFKAARKAQGAGGVFEWNGKKYTTDYKEEVEKGKKDNPRPRAKPVTKSPRPKPKPKARISETPPKVDSTSPSMGAPPKTSRLVVTRKSRSNPRPRKTR